MMIRDESLDQAADRAHAAMFEGELAAEGIERELWRNVVRAVLRTPAIMADWDELRAENRRLRAENVR